MIFSHDLIFVLSCISLGQYCQKRVAKSDGRGWKKEIKEGLAI